MHPELQAALVDGHGLVIRSEHPALVESIKRERRAGTLTRVLNGVYLAADLADSVEHRVKALARYDPDAVTTGAAAAHLSWWPELPVPAIHAYRRTSCQSATGFVWHRGLPSPELVSRHLAAPALQVLDLIPLLGPIAVDEALRRRAVSLAGLRRALELTPSRPGNQLRQAILADSRDEPWSPAEREFHRVLRSAGITGWKANLRIRLNGHTCYLDVALQQLRLAFEVDGFAHHSSRADFERDRERDAHLAAHGWQVVRISAAQVDGSATLVRAVIDARATHLQRQSRPTGI